MAYRQDQLRRTTRAKFRLPTERDEFSDDFVHTAVPIHESDGKVDGVVVYTENVTESEAQGDREGELKV